MDPNVYLGNNSIQPYFTTSGTTVVNIGAVDTGNVALPAVAPKRLPDREWLDAETDAVCGAAT